MDSASTDRLLAQSDAARAARIAERTDARCLAGMVAWMRRTPALVPWAVFFAWLAARQGAGWWAGVWLAAWACYHVAVHRLAHRLQNGAPVPVHEGLARATVVFWLASLLHALLIPVFFIGTDESVKLTATVLSVWLAGPTIISASGVLRAFAAVVLPTLMFSIGWLWHGGLLGNFLGLLFAGSLVPAFASVRQQRRSLEELVTLLDDNEALARSLKAERDRAQAASEAKTRFFAAASHDLRQPLHALSINATTLELVAGRSGDALLNELSQGIGRSLQQSRSLLDGLLDISRLDAGSIEPQVAAHDIGVLLRSVHAQFHAVAAQRGLRLEIEVGEPSPLVMTDADQLMRVLGNLVDNAIKFTGEGRVTVSAAEEDARIVVRVSDTGPGIPAAERERVFEEFYQVGNPSRDRARGLGLGLAIVRRTAALLGMDLRLASEVGRGCTFDLRMEAAPPGTLPPPSGAGPPIAMQRLSVLIVDDEADVVDSIGTYLRQLGWSVRGASGGDEAERALGDFTPDVLVVDFRLRGETAADVLARLRALRVGLPAVIVTGDTAPERLRELSTVAASVLHKPVDGATLAQALVQATAAISVRLR